MPTRDGFATDHTGKVYDSRGRQDERRLPHRSLMRNPKLLACPNCERQHFYIVADDSEHAVSGLIQIRCATPRCGTVWPEVQLSKPQMNTEVAKDARSTELWTPAIDEIVDVPRT
jgi:hypothetical protein